MNSNKEIVIVLGRPKTANDYILSLRHKLKDSWYIRYRPNSMITDGNTRYIAISSYDSMRGMKPDKIILLYDWVDLSQIDLIRQQLDYWYTTRQAEIIHRPEED